MPTNSEILEKEQREEKERKIKSVLEKYNNNIKIEKEEFKKQELYNSFISYSKGFSVALATIGIICFCSLFWIQSAISISFVVLGIAFICAAALVEVHLLWKAYVLKYIIDNEKN